MLVFLYGNMRKHPKCSNVLVRQFLCFGCLCACIGGGLSCTSSARVHSGFCRFVRMLRCYERTLRSPWQRKQAAHDGQDRGRTEYFEKREDFPEYKLKLLKGERKKLVYQGHPYGTVRGKMQRVRRSQELCQARICCSPLFTEMEFT